MLYVTLHKTQPGTHNAAVKYTSPNRYSSTMWWHRTHVCHWWANLYPYIPAEKYIHIKVCNTRNNKLCYKDFTTSWWMCRTYCGLLIFQIFNLTQQYPNIIINDRLQRGTLYNGYTSIYVVLFTTCIIIILMSLWNCCNEPNTKIFDFLTLKIWNGINRKIFIWFQIPDTNLNGNISMVIFLKLGKYL